MQWGEGLIRSWNRFDWIDLPVRVGAMIAPLIGARPGTVTVADSTSINVFKVLSVALRLRPGRKVVVSERGNFPTDLYIAQGLFELLGQGHVLRLVEAEALPGAIDDSVAAVLLTEVNYRTGALLDMKALTAATHAAGALGVWDLAHSAGAFPVDVTGADADFAIGCGYKYLNGGPGAPAFVYVAPEHLKGLRRPLSSAGSVWRPSISPPTTGPRIPIGRARRNAGDPLDVGTCRGARRVFAEVDLAWCARRPAGCSAFCGRSCGTVRAAATHHATRRGPARYADLLSPSKRLCGDAGADRPRCYRGFSPTRHLRSGLTPLYLRHVDIWRAVEILADILATEAWDRPEFGQRAKVV